MLWIVENLIRDRTWSHMGLLDNLTNTLKQGWNVAKEKGELGARVGRLRLELIRLEREREAQYARLGKAYHNNSQDAAALEPLMLEINRLTQTMRDRESVMVQLLEASAEPKAAVADPKNIAPEEPLDFAEKL
jgi:hypothetical protein